MTCSGLTPYRCAVRVTFAEHARPIVNRNRIPTGKVRVQPLINRSYASIPPLTMQRVQVLDHSAAKSEKKNRGPLYGGHLSIRADQSTK